MAFVDLKFGDYVTSVEKNIDKLTNIDADQDGFIRRYPVFYPITGDTLFHYSLGIKMALHYLGITKYQDPIFDKENEIINIGSGKTHSINSLVKLLKGKVEYLPKRPGEPDCTWANISKAKKKLKWNFKFIKR